MSDDMQTEQARHLAFTVRHYTTCAEGYSLAAVRAGHSDAAHMCDAIARDIEREHTKRGRVTKEGQALAAALKRAGDAIWAMKEALPKPKRPPHA